MSARMPESEGELATWESVWNLYARHGRVFWAVFLSLRRAGWDLDVDAPDLIHEFLVTRCRSALNTFRPERGEIEKWLFVVFRRFVIGTVRSERHHRDLLHRYRDRLFVPSQGPSAEDLVLAKQLSERLDEREWKVLTSYMSTDSNSVRSAAKELNLSRWMARKTLQAAVGKILALSDAAAPKVLSNIALRGMHHGEEMELAPMTHEIRKVNHAPDHAHLDEYFAGTPKLDARQARVYLSHMAECPTCAERSQLYPVHLSLLIEATREKVSDPEFDRMSEESVAELELVASALSEDPAVSSLTMDRALVQLHVATHLPQAARMPAHLQALALAVSEAALALRSVLAAYGDFQSATLENEGLRTPTRLIPHEYFAVRVAHHAGVAKGDVRNLWGSILRLILKGNIGIPGVAAQLRCDGSVEITPVTDEDATFEARAAQ